MLDLKIHVEVCAGLFFPSSFRVYKKNVFKICKSYNIKLFLIFSSAVPSVTQVCDSCSPAQEFIRLFDVTERTALHRHGTGRMCPHCRAELRDTIVHFGERGTLEQPLNWKGAAEAAQQADVILCLGSSLKVSL